MNRDVTMIRSDGNNREILSRNIFRNNKSVGLIARSTAGANFANWGMCGGMVYTVIIEYFLKRKPSIKSIIEQGTFSAYIKM